MMLFRAMLSVLVEHGVGDGPGFGPEVERGRLVGRQRRRPLDRHLFARQTEQFEL